LGVRWGQLILPHALNALRGGGYGVLAYDYYEYEDIILLARNYSSLPNNLQTAFNNNLH
jgi:hypothetical protein